MRFLAFLITVGCVATGRVDYLESKSRDQDEAHCRRRARHMPGSERTAEYRDCMTEREAAWMDRGRAINASSAVRIGNSMQRFGCGLSSFGC